MRKFFSMAIVAMLALVGANSTADATFVLRISDGVPADTVTIADGGAGDLAPGVPGQIIFSGSIGTFTINVTTGLGDPVLPNTSSRANMHLNNVSVSSSSGGTLTLELTQTDLALAPSIYGIGLASSFGGTTVGKVEGWQVLDLGNAQFAAPADGEAVAHHGPLSGPSFSSNATAETGPYTGTKFSLSEKVVVTHTGAGTTSFDIDSLATVPAPPSIVMGLSGLPMFVGAMWARRRVLARKQA